MAGRLGNIVLYRGSSTDNLGDLFSVSYPPPRYPLFAVGNSPSIQALQYAKRHWPTAKRSTRG